MRHKTHHRVYRVVRVALLVVCWLACLCALAGCYSPYKAFEVPSSQRDAGGSLWEPPIGPDTAFIDAAPMDRPVPDNNVCTQGSLCGQQCVDLQKDQFNCGACGALCLAAQRCVNGRCECPSGQSVCTVLCVDLNNDPNHCGACEQVCSGKQICQAGACVTLECQSSQDCPAGKRCEQNKCKGCQADADCGAEEICNAGSCVRVACQSEKDCPAGLLCRSGRCQGCQLQSDCPSLPGPPYAKKQGKATKGEQRDTFSYSMLPSARGDVSVVITLGGDYTEDVEYVTISIDDKSYGRFAPQKPSKSGEKSKTITVPGSTVNDGSLIVKLYHSRYVGVGTVAVTVRYDTVVRRKCEASRCR